MLKNSDIVKLVFGLKIQHLRKEADLSYQQLSERTGLAVSYLHSIEKGKKYPKADKILSLAEALSTDYNYLVSLEPNKRLRPIVELLQSDFLKIFPLETFGIATSKLLELLVQAPEKVNAFISTVLKITRNFNMQGEDFYKSALRSFQDLHDNYFPHLEAAANDLRGEENQQLDAHVSIEQLEQWLTQRHGIQVDRVYLSTHDTLRSLRSVYAPEQRTLYLGPNQDVAQERFLLAKELGFQFLELSERPYETRMLEVTTFEHLLANFYASYFAVALLMPEARVIGVLTEMQSWTSWQSEKMQGWLDEFELSAEMLLQRLANILPTHFDVKKLFFLRFYTGAERQKFIVTKEMHLSELHNPYANQLDEHYCRRWISISLIRRLSTSTEQTQKPIVGAQISRYWNSPNAYFCMTFAKPTRSNPEHSSSVTLGLLVNDNLLKLFPFLSDHQLLTKDVHTTCERCPIQDCEARANAPVFWLRKQRRAAVKKSLSQLQQSAK